MSHPSTIPSLDHSHISYSNQPSTRSVSELIPIINTIWEKKGIRVKQHLSEPRPGAVSVIQKRAHADRCQRLPDALPGDVDLMIEVGCRYLYGGIGCLWCYALRGAIVGIGVGVGLGNTAHIFSFHRTALCFVCLNFISRRFIRFDMILTCYSFTGKR